MIETLSLLCGDDITITDGLIIRQPTLYDVKCYDEFKYMSMVSMFVCTPYDMIAQLDKQGYDFTEVTSFQIFCGLCHHLKPPETSILFGNLDFSELRPVINEEKRRIELTGRNVIITEDVYNQMADCIRTINSIPPPKFKGVADEYTKQKMIEYAYDDLELLKHKKPKSTLRTLVSRATNHPYFKYNLNEVWDMKLYAFYDAIQSINIVESSNQLSIGAYSGNLDLSKINKNNFNWLREIEAKN